MKWSTIILCLALSISARGFSAEVIQVTWPSRFTAPPPALTPEQQRWMPAFQLAVKTLPEEAVITLVLAQGGVLGLGTNEAARLSGLFTNRYAALRGSNVYRSAPSALAYCFADRKPKNGLATVYVPDGVTNATKTIVFMHGYGGSLLAYGHYLSTCFPDYVVISPAWGIHPANVPAEYLREAQAAVSRKLGVTLSKPRLIGLSAGGVGACRIMAQAPGDYCGLICLGTFPPADATRKFGRNMEVAFLAGGNEPFVTDGSFMAALRGLRRRMPKLQWSIIPGEDHYFILSKDLLGPLKLKEWEMASPNP